MTTETTTERKAQRLPLVYFPDTKLTQVSTHISTITQEVKDLAADLVETMNQTDGVGLSAIQVGKPLRLFVMKNGDKNLVLVNPSWEKADGAALVSRQEGCLSFPSVFEMVDRYDAVVVTYQDLDGNLHEERMEVTEAHIVQHETEHLDGHLFIEHLPIHKRDRIRQKMKQRARLTARIDKVMKNGQPNLQAMVAAGMVKLQARPGFRSGR